jgi:hypothetical protein
LPLFFLLIFRNSCRLSTTTLPNGWNIVTCTYRFSSHTMHSPSTLSHVVVDLVLLPLMSVAIVTAHPATAESVSSPHIAGCRSIGSKIGMENSWRKYRC